MNVTCPGCSFIYDTNLGGAASATIICTHCKTHFDCRVVKGSDFKVRLGPFAFGKQPTIKVVTTRRPSESD